MINLSRYKWIILSLIISILFWLIESIIDSFLFFEATLFTELFNPGTHELWMRSIIILIMLAFGAYIQFSVNRARSTKEKIQELNSLLLSIRNINQLIVQKSNLEEILQESTEILNKTRGYMDTYIGLLKNKEISPIAHSGPHKRLKWSADPEEIEKAPKCIKEVIENKKTNVIWDVEEYCETCDFCSHHSNHKTIIIPILRDEKILGFMSVCLKKERDINEKEIDLLKEIASDIAFAREKIKSDKKLKESEKRYRELFESVKVGIIVNNSKGNIESINSAAEEIIGLKEKETKEKNLEYFKDKLYTENEEKIDIENFPISQVYATEEAIEEQIIGISKEKVNEIRWYIISSVPHFNEKGKIKRVITSLNDITEQKRAEERKKFLNTLLKQDLSSKNQTIQGYHELLKEAKLQNEYKEYLEKAIKVNKETNEILELSKELEKIEKTNWTANQDIIKTLNHVIKDISNLAQKKGIKIKKEYPPNMSSIQADYSINTLFKQILLTRIQNSGCKKIKITAKEEKNHISVKIEDDGQQLTKEIKNIFRGKIYSGKTAGAGGVKYYMIKQMAIHNDIKISVGKTEYGGAEFNLKLIKT